MENKIPESLQENIVVAVCFDPRSISLVANSIDLSLFESSIYRNIVSAALIYFKQFNRPIGTHLPDEFDHFLNPNSLKREAQQKSEMYRDVIEKVYKLYKSGFNTEYVLENLRKFIRTQNQKKSIMEAHDLIMSNASPDEVDNVLDKYRKGGADIFDAGLFFDDPEQALAFLDRPPDSNITTGIEHLDKYGMCPSRNQLFAFAGLSGRGKTWFLIHMAKRCILLNKRVLHISLEMPQDDLSSRYCQTLFSVSNRDETFKVPVFETDEFGNFMDVDFDRLKADHHFKHPRIRQRLLKEHGKGRKRKLVIKDFPTGSLSLEALKAYLDSLANHYEFKPDLIMIDYPDLMKVKGRDKTEEMDNLFINLRGLSFKKEYDCAIAVVSQINRQGKRSDAEWFDEGFLTGAYSRFFHSDIFITYNQDNDERDIGLARLLVVKGRRDKTGLRVAITQSYDTGQFCLTSVPLKGNVYNNVLKEYRKEDKGEAK